MKEYTNGRLDSAYRWLGCALACIVGLAGLGWCGSAEATTQSQARATCDAWRADWKDHHQLLEGWTRYYQRDECELHGDSVYPCWFSSGDAMCYSGIIEAFDTLTSSGYQQSLGNHDIFAFDTYSCDPGETAFVHTNASTPGTICKNHCVYTGSGDGTEVRVNPGDLVTGYKKYESTGQSCQSDTPMPDGHICNDATGVCIDYDPNDGGHFCDSAGNCRSVPEPSPGGCTSSSGDALCGAPGGGDSQGNGGGDGGGTNPSGPGAGPQNPSGPTPQPPSPPFVPNSSPTNQWNVSVSTHGGGGITDTSSNESQHQCGGAGQEPCSNGSSACPAGQYRAPEGNCISPASQCLPPSSWNGSQCVVASQCSGTVVNGVCQGSITCPENTTLQNGSCVGVPICSSGTSWDSARSQCVGSETPHCPPGEVVDNDGVCHAGSCPAGWTNVDGQCEQNPNQCPSGQTEVNGVCVDTCPAGQTRVNGTCQQVNSGDCVGGTVSGSGSSAVCTCPTGQSLVNGVCALQKDIQCVNGLVVQGNCVCPPNYQLWQGVCYYAQAPTSGGSGSGSGSGSGTGTSGSGTGQGVDTCALHPNAAGCVVHSSSGGSDCGGAAPSCSGDPIMCNELFQSWMERCILQKSIDQAPTDDDLHAATRDPSVGEYTIDGSQWDASGSGLASAGGCALVPDAVVFGVTLHFESVWCDLFTWIGQLVIVAAYFMAARLTAAG